MAGTGTGNLARWDVAITRPVGQSGVLARHVRAFGGTPLVLPSASLRPAADPIAARRALAAIGARAFVFTSPAAVRYAFALAPKFKPSRRAGLIAVGPSTQRALARHGWSALCPPKRHDSEGVLELPALAGLRSGIVVLVGAPGGRDVLAENLRARRLRVVAAQVYRRALPRWTSAHHRALAQAPRRLLWLVSSVEAIGNVKQLAGVDGWARLSSAIAIASSERVAAALRAAGVSRIHCAGSALPAALLETAVRAAR